MFSKFRKSKQDKPYRPRDLRGMPALKQMRSSRREESLKNGSNLSILCELEKKAIAGGNEAVYPMTEEPGKIETPYFALTPNYKRSVSPDSGHHSNGNRQTNRVDRISCANGSTFVFYGDLPPGVAEDIPEENEDVDEENVSVDTPWRFSKGDSGYKSKDDEKAESKGKKQKKSRRKSSGRPACGLHQIKQQRKASRDEISMSMRALTPRERESIQCLEDVLKNHPDEDESLNEVFESESDHEYANEADRIFMEAKQRVEAVDHGYASVNDVSRRYSVDSAESVESFIDLVGDISASPSSQTSPLYSTVEESKKADPIMVRSNDDVFLDRFDSVISPDEGIQNEEEGTNLPSYDDTARHDEAISHLDDVINSFSFQSDEEREKESKREELEKTDIRIQEDETEVKEAWRGPGKEIDSRNERKKKKKSRRRKSRDSASDDEKDKKRRERRKERAAETEKERKERKKQRKEETRMNKKEKEDPTDEERRREENIARHVDEISTLTQNMIRTAQKNSETEPIYAQVKKIKKNKDINGNLQLENVTTLEEKVPNPPSPFANPTQEEIELQRQQIVSKTPERQSSFSRFHLTSTPIASDVNTELSHTSMRDETISIETHRETLHQPISDSSQYANGTDPNSSGLKPPARLHVSQSMLEDTSQNLKHVSPSGPKVLQVDPCRNSIEQRIYEPTPPPQAFRDQPITRADPLRTSDPIEPQDVRRRPPRVTRNITPGRPMSLNLEENVTIGFLGEDKRRGASKKHSSFREDNTNDADQGKKPKPFVIRTLKKPIQLY